ncbi:MAG: MATE family efflux transporter [Clostridia bacterium]|nr:MATE family efflux transporter [Clostridia bacterium]
MKNPKVRSMTQGNPTALLAMFALPMLIGNLFQQAYNLADSVVVGQFIGASALAAIGATSSVTFLFFSICNGISSGCGIVTSQLFGAGDPVRTKRAVANSAYVMMAAAVVMGAVAYAASPMALRLMGTPEDILPDAILYMRMSCIGVPLVGVYNYTASMLRALGDSRTPLYFLIFACFLNIVLDLLFVCVFGMAVFGAALATIIAQMVAGVGGLVYVLRNNPYFMLRRQDFKPDRAIIFKSVKLGLPIAMQWSLIAVSTTALQSFVNGFGTAAVAAYTALSRIEQLVHQPYGSLNAALATYAGQNYGAGRMDRVKLGLKHSLLLSGAFTVLIFAVMQLFGDAIVSMFVSDPEVIRLGSEGLRLTSWFYVSLALIYMTRGVLNGVGDALFSLINGSVEVACRVAMPPLLMLIPAMGVESIWWVTGLTWLVSAVFCLLRYDRWKRKKA